MALLMRNNEDIMSGKKLSGASPEASGSTRGEGDWTEKKFDEKVNIVGAHLDELALYAGLSSKGLYDSTSALGAWTQEVGKMVDSVTSGVANALVGLEVALRAAGVLKGALKIGKGAKVAEEAVKIGKGAKVAEEAVTGGKLVRDVSAWAGTAARGGAEAAAAGAPLLPKVGEELLVKGGTKMAAKGASKFLIGTGIALGLGLGAQRAMGGDIEGGGLEVLSGISSAVPGVGTGASLGIDGYLMGGDAGIIDRKKFDPVINRVALESIPAISAPYKVLGTVLSVIRTIKQSDDHKLEKKEQPWTSHEPAQDDHEHPAKPVVGAIEDQTKQATYASRDILAELRRLREATEARGNALFPTRQWGVAA
jgi:hypothetical protein